MDYKLKRLVLKLSRRHRKKLCKTFFPLCAILKNTVDLFKHQVTHWKVSYKMIFFLPLQSFSLTLGKKKKLTYLFPWEAFQPEDNSYTSYMFRFKWKWSHWVLSDFETPWTVAYQAPPFMVFSRQEYWSGVPLPSPGDLPDPGIKPWSSALQADALPSEPPGEPLVKMSSI